MNKEMIAKNLTELRGDRTREEVSKALNISISTLQMYENGQRIPRDVIKMKIAEYYQKNVGEIFFVN